MGRMKPGTVGGVWGRTPLLAPRLRLPAVAAVVVSIAVTIGMSVHFANLNGPGRFDRTLDDLAVSTLQNPAWSAASAYFVKLGDPGPFMTLVGAVALWAALTRRWPGVLLVVLGTAGAVAITKVVLKPLVGRYYGHHLSFPSTHATALASLAIATVLILTSARWPRPVALRVMVIVVPLAIAMGTSVAVVATRTHYTTDTIAAWCVALATVLISAFAIDFLWQWLRRPRSPATAGAAGGERRRRCRQRERRKRNRSPLRC